MSDKKLGRVELKDEALENVAGGILMTVGTVDDPKINWTNINTGEVIATYSVTHENLQEVADWLKANYWDYGDEKAIAYLQSIGWIK